MERQKVVRKRVLGGKKMEYESGGIVGKERFVCVCVCS